MCNKYKVYWQGSGYTTRPIAIQCGTQGLTGDIVERGKAKGTGKGLV